ncbi:hypothetical protein ACROYT_G040295 [Oculina patagonica]
MLMWDKTVGKRGSSEVASCLFKFLTKFHSGARSLVSFSDGCGGQNKNRTVVALFAELHQRGIYEVLNHRGHTFLENDIDFLQIEKRKKNSCCYIPQDWMKVVEETNQTKPFVVTEIQQNDLRDWES